MNIALVDDDRELLEKLRVLMIQQFAEVSDRLYNIDTFESAEEFFADWSAGKYGLIVLDIYMGDANGITAAERIRETDSDVRIAFCTSSNEFATETYGVNASDYLQKPITAEKVARLLQKANFEKIEKRTRRAASRRDISALPKYNLRRILQPQAYILSEIWRALRHLLLVLKS